MLPTQVFQSLGSFHSASFPWCKATLLRLTVHTPAAGQWVVSEEKNEGINQGPRLSLSLFNIIHF